MLDGCKIINFVLAWDDDYSTWVLTCRPFYADAGVDEAIYLRFVQFFLTIFEIFDHIAIRGFRGKRAERARAEDILASEELLGVFVHFALHFSGEIQVNIRRFVAIKPKKCLKWYVMPISGQLFTADRTLFVWKIEPGTDRTIGYKFRIFTFLTIIMRRKRVDLRNSGH